MIISRFHSQKGKCDKLIEELGERSAKTEDAKAAKSLKRRGYKLPFDATQRQHMKQGTKILYTVCYIYTTIDGIEVGCSRSSPVNIACFFSMFFHA